MLLIEVDQKFAKGMVCFDDGAVEPMTIHENRDARTNPGQQMRAAVRHFAMMCAAGRNKRLPRASAPFSSLPYARVEGFTFTLKTR